MAAEKQADLPELEVIDLPSTVVSSSTEDLKSHLARHGLEMGDEDHIRWEKTNRKHPRNWSPWRKTYDFGLLIFLDFFTTVISTAGTPASSQAATELSIGQTLSLFSFVSIYMIAQAIGGVFFPPYSESFGRKRLFVLAAGMYCVFSIIIATVDSLAAIIVGRFVTGLASALPTIVIAGSAEDIFDTGKRIWMIYAWAVAANSGICVGPIVGAFVTDSLGWRWIFYISAIVTGLCFCLLFGIKESRSSQLLEKAVTAVRKESGIPSLRIRNPDHMPDFQTFARVALIRPLRLFFTEPIVFICTVLSAVAFGLLYLLTEALPVVYASFGFTPGQASLSFIPIVIGILSGILTRLWDHRVYKQRRSARQPVLPEDKLIGFAIGAVLLAVGLWWFAWTTPPQAQSVHWIVSMLSLLLVGYATNEFDCVLAGYIADSYTIFAASAFASIAFLRALCCAMFPLFAYRMYTDISPNLATSILAAVATVFCAGPVLFLRYGRKLREKSPFAKYSLQAYRQNNVDQDVI